MERGFHRMVAIIAPRYGSSPVPQPLSDRYTLRRWVVIAQSS